MAPTDQSSSFNFNFNVVNEYEHYRDGYNRYGNNSYGNNSYGNHSYGNNRYGNNSYGNNSYGNHSYGNNRYGNNSYGNNSYGNHSYGNNRYGNNSYGNNSYGNHSYGNNRYGNNRYPSTSSTSSSSSGYPQFGRNPQQHRPSLLATPGPSRAAVGTLSHGSRSHESPLMLTWLESQRKDGFLCYYHRRHGNQAENCESSLCMKYAEYVKQTNDREAQNYRAYMLGEQNFKVIPKKFYPFKVETQENPDDFVNGSQLPPFSCGFCPCFDITSAYPYMAQTPEEVRPSLLMNTWGYLMASPTSQPLNVVQPYVQVFYSAARNQIYQANCRGG